MACADFDMFGETLEIKEVELVYRGQIEVSLCE